MKKNGHVILVMMAQEEYERLVRSQNLSAKKPFPFDCAKDDPLVPGGDAWWQPMSEEEYKEFLEYKN